MSAERGFAYSSGNLAAGYQNEGENSLNPYRRRAIQATKKWFSNSAPRTKYRENHQGSGYELPLPFCCDCSSIMVAKR